MAGERGRSALRRIRAMMVRTANSPTFRFLGDGTRRVRAGKHPVLDALTGFASVGVLDICGLKRRLRFPSVLGALYRCVYWLAGYNHRVGVCPCTLEAHFFKVVGHSDQFHTHVWEVWFAHATCFHSHRDMFDAMCWNLGSLAMVLVHRTFGMKKKTCAQRSSCATSHSCRCSVRACTYFL